MISKIGPFTEPRVDVIQTADVYNPISMGSLHDFTVIFRLVFNSFVTRRSGLCSCVLIGLRDDLLVDKRMNS
jgi:hypothetical protein